MLKVVVEKLELETFGKAVHGPGLGVGLVAAHHQAADLLLPVGETVRIAQGREIGRHAVDFLGDEILVLHRDERNIDAGHAAKLARPLPGADHELVASDAALVGDDRTQAPALHLDAGDLYAFSDGDAVLARALGQRHGDVGGRNLAVGRQESGADDVIDLHERP